MYISFMLKTSHLVIKKNTGIIFFLIWSFIHDFNQKALQSIKLMNKNTLVKGKKLQKIYKTGKYNPAIWIPPGTYLFSHNKSNIVKGESSWVNCLIIVHLCVLILVVVFKRFQKTSKCCLHTVAVFGKTFRNFWSSMLFNFVIYLAF